MEYTFPEALYFFFEILQYQHCLAKGQFYLYLIPALKTDSSANCLLHPFSNYLILMEYTFPEALYFFFEILQYQHCLAKGQFYLYLIPALKTDSSANCLLHPFSNYLILMEYTFPEALYFFFEILKIYFFYCSLMLGVEAFL